MKWSGCSLDDTGCVEAVQVALSPAKKQNFTLVISRCCIPGHRGRCESRDALEGDTPLGQSETKRCSLTVHCYYMLMTQVTSSLFSSPVLECSTLLLLLLVPIPYSSSPEFQFVVPLQPHLCTASLPSTHWPTDLTLCLPWPI